MQDAESLFVVNLPAVAEVIASPPVSERIALWCIGPGNLYSTERPHDIPSRLNRRADDPRRVRRSQLRDRESVPGATVRTGWRICVSGVLPMANLLAVGLLPWLRRQPHRAGFRGFRVGFEVCGMLAMVAFLALSLRFTDYLFQLPQSFFEPYLKLEGQASVSWPSALLIFGSSGFAVGNIWCTDAHKVVRAMRIRLSSDRVPGTASRPPQWK